MTTILHFYFLATIFISVESINIIWDKDAPADYNEVEHGRMEDVRMPNWMFIYPGTKWCGAGNIAANNDDLGNLASDKCCRAHDLCTDIIEAYQTAHNLTNNRFFTSLNCQCDKDFYKCLKSINSRDSRTIGNIYFNALGQQCFKMAYPIKSCQKNVYFPSKKCVLYEFNENLEKLYQWFDVPIF